GRLPWYHRDEPHPQETGSRGKGPGRLLARHGQDVPKRCRGRRFSPLARESSRNIVIQLLHARRYIAASGVDDDVGGLWRLVRRTDTRKVLDRPAPTLAKTPLGIWR